MELGWDGGDSGGTGISVEPLVKGEYMQLGGSPRGELQCVDTEETMGLL